MVKFQCQQANGAEALNKNIQVSQKHSKHWTTLTKGRLFVLVICAFQMKRNMVSPFYPEASADELQPVPDHFLKSICQH